MLHRLHEDACRRGYDAQLGCFVQSYGSRQLEASLLLIRWWASAPSDPRVQGTVAAIERRLLREGFVLRCDTA